MDTRPIGVFDSGLGGLTALRELARLMPEEDLVYFGDTGRVPYGGRSPEVIVFPLAFPQMVWYAIILRWEKGGTPHVIGTRASIRSGAYERALNQLHPGVVVTARACPLLVPLVENGRFRPGDTVAKKRCRPAPGRALRSPSHSSCFFTHRAHCSPASTRAVSAPINPPMISFIRG